MPQPALGRGLVLGGLGPGGPTAGADAPDDVADIVGDQQRAADHLVGLAGLPAVDDVSPQPAEPAPAPHRGALAV